MRGDARVAAIILGELQPEVMILLGFSGLVGVTAGLGAGGGSCEGVILRSGSSSSSSSSFISHSDVSCLSGTGCKCAVSGKGIGFDVLFGVRTDDADDCVALES